MEGERMIIIRTNEGKADKDTETITERICKCLGRMMEEKTTRWSKIKDGCGQTRSKKSEEKA